MTAAFFTALHDGDQNARREEELTPMLLYLY